MQQYTQPHILIIEDDRKILEMLSDYLKKNGYHVTPLGSGKDIQSHLSTVSLVLLDVMLPNEDGFSICQKIRSSSKIPIILLTAVTGDADKVLGLELGADDYVSKPFSPRELLARIRSLLRRSDMSSLHERKEQAVVSYEFSGWILDTRKRTLVSPKGTLIYMTSGEFDLLVVFVENPQRSISRDELLFLLHGRNPNPFDRSIDVQVSRLRRKLEPMPDRPEIIKTIRGAGYFFSSDVNKKQS